MDRPYRFYQFKFSVDYTIVVILNFQNWEQPLEKIHATKATELYIAISAKRYLFLESPKQVVCCHYFCHFTLILVDF